MVEAPVVPMLRVSGRNVRDITGASFGAWTVLAFVGTAGKVARWLARCTCGEVRVLSGNSLRSGSTKSCGCVGDSAFAAGLLRHGHARTKGASRTPTYLSWQSMMDRCTGSNRRWWPRYGGRGITVHADWRDFATFLRDMGERPPGTWLDRIDNDRNYEPGNCRWATPTQQQANKSSNRIVEYHGEKRALVEWARALDLNYQTLQNRIHVQGLDPAEAIERPGIGPFSGTRSGRAVGQTQGD